MYMSALIVHATSMSVALALLVLGEVLFNLARLGHAGPLKLAMLANRVVAPFIAIGILSGIALLAFGSWPLLTPWLLCSFALIVLLVSIEGRIVKPWSTQVDRLLSSGATGPGLLSVIADNRALLGRLGMIAIFALVVVVMRGKPDFGRWF